MDEFSEVLTELLEESYRHVSKIEEAMLNSAGSVKLSMHEIHLLEAVARGGDAGVIVSDLAQSVQVSVPSMTVAIKKLVAKGCVYKVRAGNDGRKQYVHLTRLGTKLNHAHRYFHAHMVRSVIENIRTEERDVLVRGLKGINDFFSRMLEDMNKSEDAK